MAKQVNPTAKRSSPFGFGKNKNTSKQIFVTPSLAAAQTSRISSSLSSPSTTSQGKMISEINPSTSKKNSRWSSLTIGCMSYNRCSKSNDNNELYNFESLLRQRKFDVISEVLLETTSSQEFNINKNVRNINKRISFSLSSSNHNINYEEIKQKWFNAEYTMTGENCLHRLVKARPPASVVSLLLQSLIEFGIEEPELSVDDLEQTPLHHAVANLCHPDVLRVLIQRQQQQQGSSSHPKRRKTTTTCCLVQDVEGRLPLHIAMRPYNLLNNSDRARYLIQQNPSKIQEIMRANIDVLVNACPKSLLVKDDKGKTPPEHAKSLVFDEDFENFVQDMLHKCTDSIMTEKFGTRHSSADKKNLCKRQEDCLIAVDVLNANYFFAVETELSALSFTAAAAC